MADWNVLDVALSHMGEAERLAFGEPAGETIGPALRQRREAVRAALAEIDSAIGLLSDLRGELELEG